jgi:dihydropyrimidine dehydrogenase (NADP+)
LALHPKIKIWANAKPTRITKQDRPNWKRNFPKNFNLLKGNFLTASTIQLNEKAALAEAQRCLKCLDAPCEKGCPGHINIKDFIASIANKNYYGAAKTILSDNPLGFTCGMICPTSELCSSCCNLSTTEEGPINIQGLQAFAVDVFRQMNVPQIRDPSKDWSKLDDSYKTKIALIGGGPASMSCATFLARLGYSDITIFEKNDRIGGATEFDIPQPRLPQDITDFEVKLLTDLGVKIKYNSALGRDFTVESLKKDGYEVIFYGIGQPNPQRQKVFDGLTEKEGFYTSKDFLPLVTRASKPGCSNCNVQLSKLHGTVIVLGAGDVAMDCASMAIRCGAKKVYVAFRRGTTQIRAVKEEYLRVMDEQCELMPRVVVKQIITKDGKISAVEFHKTDVEGSKVIIDEESLIRMKCDFIISAFGCTLNDSEVVKASLPLKINDWGLVEVNDEMQTEVPYIFAGGDIIGNGTVIEAVNDGKVASWNMHRYIQSLHKKEVPKEPQLPRFFTEIDTVDLSIEVAGMKFPNPFGIASGPASSNEEQIRRAFECGWGFAVTKTFTVDKHICTNCAPRISRGTTTDKRGPHQSAFLNIDLITEKSANYWIRTIKNLKRDFPDRILIAAIVGQYTKEHWIKLAKHCEEAGADALELSLSCPQENVKKGEEGKVVGEDPQLVKQLCQWVRSAVKIPFFCKLTPNITDVVPIARAAIEGGATGVTATNTVKGIMEVRPDATCWPAVGDEQLTTVGGLSGNAIKPIALKAVAYVAKGIKDAKILATGGIDSAKTALEFIYCGAQVCQISSAIQNQDLSIVEDYITGLKALMYLSAHAKSYKGWIGQSPPPLKMKYDLYSGKELPKFGNYEKQRREILQKEIEQKGLIQDIPIIPVIERDPSVKVPPLSKFVGRALPKIVKFDDFGDVAEKHAVAKINRDLCINCGKCFMSCQDCGFMAIHFDRVKRLPRVDVNKCTGCGLCTSICPINDCIVMVPREGRYIPDRGIPLDPNNPF